MKFTIITVVFNGRDTIEDCINSVQSQNFSEVEHLIIDGGSTDGTCGIVEKSNGRNVKLVSEPDNGLYDALNKGVRYASGDIIGFIHADDLLADSSVLSEVAAVFRETDADCVYGNLVYVAKNNTDKIIRYWRSGEYSPSRLKYGWMPPHPALYVKRQIYEKAKLPDGDYFDTSLSISADYDFMTRILGKFDAAVAYLPKVLVKMRLGGKSNRSFGNIIRKSYEDYLIIRRNEAGGIFTLLAKNFRKIPQFFTR